MTKDVARMDSPEGLESEIPPYPPPGYPNYVQGFGYTLGIERLRREAREAWEREYGAIYERIRKAK